MRDMRKKLEADSEILSRLYIWLMNVGLFFALALLTDSVLFRFIVAGFLLILGGVIGFYHWKVHRMRCEMRHWPDR